LREWLGQLGNPRSATPPRSAAFALGQLGDRASFAIGDLAPLVRSDRDAPVREVAAPALGGIIAAPQGPQHPGYIRRLWEQSGGTLDKALRNDIDPRVKRSAAYALGCFGPQASGTLPALKLALRDKHPGVRQNAAWALGRLGRDVDGAGI